ncbi:MAG: class I SAM-dependent methyltransferase [Candidatus Micrarchaeia archaeon]|jgi:hypothetical protein
MTGRKIVELGPGEYPMRTRFTSKDYERDRVPIRLRKGEAYYPVDTQVHLLKRMRENVRSDVEVHPIDANLKSLPLKTGSVDEVHASFIGGMLQVIYKNTSKEGRGDEKIRPDGSRMLAEAHRVLKPRKSLYLHAELPGDEKARAKDIAQIQKNIAAFGFEPHEKVRIVYSDDGLSVPKSSSGYGKAYTSMVLRFKKK